MRIIDADAVKFDYSGLAYVGPYDFLGIADYFAQQIREMPTLARVTAERDAAIADLKTICDCDYCANNCVNAEESICEFCEVESCLCRGCIGGGNWTWSGLQKDEDR